MMELMQIGAKPEAQTTKDFCLMSLYRSISLNFLIYTKALQLFYRALELCKYLGFDLTYSSRE